MPLELAQDGAQLASAALVERADLLGGTGSQNELVTIKTVPQLGHAGVTRPGAGVRALHIAAVLTILKCRFLADYPGEAD